MLQKFTTRFVALGLLLAASSAVSYSFAANGLLDSILDNIGGISTPPAAPQIDPVQTPSPSMGAAAPDRLIVKYKSGVADTLRRQILEKVNATLMSRLGSIQADLVHVPEGRSLQDMMAQLKANPNVEYAEPDYKLQADGNFTNDPSVGNLWGLDNTGQNGGKADADIDLPEAWNIYKPAYGLIVGIIDTGIDYNHPDLAPVMWINSVEDINKDGRFTSADNNGKDDDGNGFIDDVVGWDWVNNDNNPMDDKGHGTHVAGTIAARANNSIGVAGVAGKSNCRVMALKFLDANGSGYTSNAIKALDYAGRKKALITNNSWGGGSYSQSLYNAIYKYRQASGLFVASAGNNGRNADSSPSYPAAYNLDNIISVASTTNTDGLSSFSNYGLKSVDLGAPGSSIYSTLPGSRYGYMSGTSMAAPHVSGTAALLWSQIPSVGLLKIKSVLLGSARKISALNGKTVSGGVVNAQSALQSTR
jgi:subtilisin family serine protease